MASFPDLPPIDTQPAPFPAGEPGSFPSTNEESGTEDAAAEVRMGKALLGVGDHLVAYDREWRYTYVNEAAARILGKSREELLGQCLWELFPSAVGNQYYQELHAAFTEQRVIRSEHFYAPWNRWFENFIYPSAEGVTVFSSDVTHRHQTEEHLRRSEARYRALVEASSQVVWSWAPPAAGGDYSAVQHWWEALTGQPPAEQDGIGWLDVVHPDDRPAATAAWERAMGAGTILETEYRVRALDGDYLHILSRAVPIRTAEGAVLEWVGMMIDVTERRRAEAAVRASEAEHRRLAEALREADRRKDEFLAMLAHELRNPLAPIVHAVRILDETLPGDAASRRQRKVIERQAEHLARLVDDLLDVSRLNYNRISLQRLRVKLCGLVEEAAQAYRPMIAEAGLELQVELPETGLWIDADPTRIVQIVGNLLSNAAKYTPSGGWIRLGVRETDGVAEIRVHDNGRGIAANLLPHIFDLFMQDTRTLDRSQGGLGIGLTLVRKLTELHDGEVTVRSDGPGRGAEFTVRLPLRNDERGTMNDEFELVGNDEAEPLSFAAAGDPDSDPHRSSVVAHRSQKRVLVVDDNRDAADTLGDLLEISGHAVRVVYGGDEALEAFAEERPDVVLLDIGLPGRDGYQIARLLRANCQSAGQSPPFLVAITGYGQAEDRRRALEAGFDQHLTKPVDPDRLLHLLAQVSK